MAPAGRTSCAFGQRGIELLVIRDNGAPWGIPKSLGGASDICPPPCWYVPSRLDPEELRRRVELAVFPAAREVAHVGDPIVVHG